ncbi:flagellin [Hylemonella gracilis str. Niagara R]|uniref:Flagellin n=1 Tax=Hylemonella gracilis str. Niagara R TaxID=1458275 RepID=A0A016XHH3_9BURK|nr:flagellinolysin [Hylemonella gracilis]EYC50648.1 flagellin [Hylemonella gracilis str. Niagara R]
MTLTINTNLLSLTARRNLASSDASFTTTIERLSSGLRVNSARDDAAGLAISDRFTSQIRGQNQAMRNANDAVSLLQTAEGAISNVSGSLQRIRELAIQSANATNSVSDRQALQQEVSQLLAEIDRVGVSTEFNTLKVFDQFRNKMVAGGTTGDPDKDAVIEGLQGGWLENTEAMIQAAYGIGGSGNSFTIDLSVFSDGAGGTAARVTSLVGPSGPGTNITLEIDMADFVPPNLPNGGTAPFYSDRIIAHEMVHAIMATGQSWGELANDGTATWFLEGVAEFIHGADERVQADGVAATLADNILAWGSTSVDYSSAYTAVRYLHATTGGTGVTNMLQHLQNTPGQTLSNAFAAVTPYASTAAFVADYNANKAAFIAGFNFGNADTGAIGGADVDGGPVMNAEDIVNDAGSTISTNVLSGFNEIWNEWEEGSGGGTGNILRFHVGANANQTIDTAIGGMNLGALNLTDVDISDVNGANKAILRMDQALEYTSRLRANLGAQMSRFEQTINNLQISAENLTASRSRIVDADFAQETAALSRAQVLQQAGTAMVAQANQIPQGVLALLR